MWGLLTMHRDSVIDFDLKTSFLFSVLVCRSVLHATVSKARVVYTTNMHSAFLSILSYDESGVKDKRQLERVVLITITRYLSDAGENAETGLCEMREMTNAKRVEGPYMGT